MKKNKGPTTHLQSNAHFSSMATTYDFEIDAAMAALDTESLYGLQPEFEDLDTINQAFVIKTSTKKVI